MHRVNNSWSLNSNKILIKFLNHSNSSQTEVRYSRNLRHSCSSNSSLRPRLQLGNSNQVTEVSSNRNSSSSHSQS